MVVDIVEHIKLGHSYRSDFAIFLVKIVYKFGIWFMHF